MSDFSLVMGKLNAFIQKYYVNELLKGLILFIGIGFLLFLLITSVEYFLWLNSTGRLVLLITFIIAEIFLLYRFIGIPLGYLGRLKNGIDNKTASKLIGKHFPEVSDKLTNLLDLSDSRETSDLLGASIEQKSKQLGDVPFVSAINFSKSLRLSRILVIPALIVIAFAFAGKLSSFFQGYQRVKNYDIAYAQPAPFEFLLENESLSFLEGQEVIIKVKTIGDVVPSQVLLRFNGKDYLMKSNGNNFSYDFGAVVSSGNFNFSANGYDSRPYDLEVGSVPLINDFQMYFKYPAYLNKESEVVNGTGNGVVPEGTFIRWELNTSNTVEVIFSDRNEERPFILEEEVYRLEEIVSEDIDYTVTTSNQNIDNYEKLNYHIDVVKDEYPSIEVKRSVDSIVPNSSYYQGLVTDDYGVKSITLVYYKRNSPENKEDLLIAQELGSGGNFSYEFPTGLEVEDDVNYQLYFLVTDNDGLHGGKTAKSEVFDATIYGRIELREKELDSYKSVLENFEKSISKSNEQQKALEEINSAQKQTEALSFNEKNKIKDFIQKQEAQEEMMKSFSKKLAKDLEKKKENSESNELLKERLLRQEMEAEKNRKLLEELDKVADKIEKEELQKRLEELSKKQSSGKRNLEQLLELTKRYYVTEKANQVANDLENLANDQEKIAKEVIENQVSENEQEELNEDFNKIDRELEELKKDNQDLKKPMDLVVDKPTQNAVKQDQKDALEELQKFNKKEEDSAGEQQDGKKKNASNKMGSAAKKMKKLSEGLRQSMSMSGGGSSIAEDAEMLRQILENLITFSFKQEDLFDRVNEGGTDLSQTSFAVRKQQELRGLFEHVDDSLFALSLRQPDLSEFVNDEITEVYYNIDKALENIAENQIYQGASYQQYVLSSSNSLADYLAKMLDNMQQSMMQGQGQGQGNGFQLPDIIKAQQQLGEKMGQMSGHGQGGKQSSGEGKEGNKSSKQEDKNGGNKGNGQNDKGSEGSKGDVNNKGQSKGESGEGYSPGEGLWEEGLDEIYEIYKEQQTIREALEKQLTDLISNPDNQLAKKLIRQMESFENELLENGITQKTVNRMNSIQHELMKLENAALEQGKKKERESNTNLNDYSSPTNSNMPNGDMALPSIEILNRQALPLQNKMSKKVQGYFEKENKF